MKNSFKFSIILTLVAFSLIILGISNYTDKQRNQTADIEDSTALALDNTLSLKNLFTEQSYTWPIQDPQNIPDISLASVPKDLNKLTSIHEKKTLFIRILLPIILKEQQRITKLRKQLIRLFEKSGNTLSIESNPWFASLINEYRIDKSLDSEAQKQLLLKRIDTLPVELIITQAAIESGWGTSRFAIEGNNLFGQWTFSEENGLVPDERQQGKTHLVRKFDSLSNSIRSYLKNVNRNRAYQELRDARFDMRSKGGKMNAVELASHLHRYSEKGEDYIEIVQRILTSREIMQISALNLNKPATTPSS